LLKALLPDLFLGFEVGRSGRIGGVHANTKQRVAVACAAIFLRAEYAHSVLGNAANGPGRQEGIRGVRFFKLCVILVAVRPLPRWCGGLAD
jgi:hypothetical protein